MNVFIRCVGLLANYTRAIVGHEALVLPIPVRHKRHLELIADRASAIPLFSTEM